MQWWRGALVYELDARSFADSDATASVPDGLRGRLGYLELLGVDVVWLELTPSPIGGLSTRCSVTWPRSRLVDAAQELRL